MNKRIKCALKSLRDIKNEFSDIAESIDTTSPLPTKQYGIKWSPMYKKHIVGQWAEDIQEIIDNPMHGIVGFLKKEGEL